MCFRLTVLHPFATVYYAIKDGYDYLIHRKWRLLYGGVLNCYGAHFGGGKTLTMAHFVTKLYKRYDNKRVWDSRRKMWVIQKIHVLSNFELTQIPYEYLSSLTQIRQCADRNAEIDEKYGLRTVTLVLIDEASVQFNSRNFKSNIDATFLNTLLTCRHYHINMWYSSQKFKLSDALLRNVTQKYVNCKKIWRYEVLCEYDADEVEYATNPMLIKPIRRTGYFIKDKDYASYDTLAVVDALKKAYDENDLISEEEILALRGINTADNEQIVSRSSKHKRRYKRK